MVIRKHDNDEPKFTMCPNGLIRHLSPIGLKTYLAVKSFDWTGDGAFPGQKTIAERAGSSDRTVRRGLDELLKTGAIIREPRRRSYLYRFPPIADDWEPADLSGSPASEPAHLSGLTGGSVQSEPADLSSEVNKGNRRTLNRRNGSAGGQAASSGGEEPGSQGLGEVGATAGPGSTDGPPLATDGPGCNPGALAETPGSAGPTAGSGPGQSNDLETANKKKHWASREATESKGERYKRPLDDPETEFQASLVTQFAIDRMGIPESRRNSTMTSARFLLDDDKRDPVEVRKVIDRAVGNSSEWQHIDALFMVKKHYAEILADADSGTAPQKDKPQDKSAKPAADIRSERTPEEWAALRAQLEAWT